MNVWMYVYIHMYMCIYICACFIFLARSLWNIHVHHIRFLHWTILNIHIHASTHTCMVFMSSSIATFSCIYVLLQNWRYIHTHMRTHTDQCMRDWLLSSAILRSEIWKCIHIHTCTHIKDQCMHLIGFSKHPLFSILALQNLKMYTYTVYTYTHRISRYAPDWLL